MNWTNLVPWGLHRGISSLSKANSHGMKCSSGYIIQPIKKHLLSIPCVQDSLQVFVRSYLAPGEPCPEMHQQDDYWGPGDLEQNQGSGVPDDLH